MKLLEKNIGLSKILGAQVGEKVATLGKYF